MSNTVAGGRVHSAGDKRFERLSGKDWPVGDWPLPCAKYRDGDTSPGPMTRWDVATDCRHQVRRGSRSKHVRDEDSARKVHRGRRASGTTSSNATVKLSLYPREFMPIQDHPRGLAIANSKDGIDSHPSPVGTGSRATIIWSVSGSTVSTTAVLLRQTATASQRAAPSFMTSAFNPRTSVILSPATSSQSKRKEMCSVIRQG